MSTNASVRRRAAREAQFDNDVFGYAPLRGLRYADHEIPTGVVNGVNKVFNFANVPSPQESLQLYADKGDGKLVIMVQGTDYTLVQTTVTLAVAPTVSPLGWYRF